MIVIPYISKMALKESVGKRLHFIETSLFGMEYVSTGKITGANRPHIAGVGKEFFAKVTMKDDIIIKVE